MGTSGSWSGSGGAIGDAIRDRVRDWINSRTPAEEVPSKVPDDDREGGVAPESLAHQKLDPDVLLPIVGLFRPRMPRGGGSDGPSAGGSASSGGGASSGGRRSVSSGRTVAASVRSAGRAAAAAYAYRSGDVAALGRLGLNYAELTELGDSLEITRRIVEAACGARGNSTIEDHEQRLVAADVAEWVLTEDPGGRVPAPEEIVRHTIALIIAEAVLGETGEIVSNCGHSVLAEQEIRDAAEALAAREELSPEGVSEAEFAAAIERGIETLRGVLE